MDAFRVFGLLHVGRTGLTRDGRHTCQRVWRVERVGTTRRSARPDVSPYQAHGRAVAVEDARERAGSAHLPALFSRRHAGHHGGRGAGCVVPVAWEWAACGRIV
jgi:hypothetical protein